MTSSWAPSLTGLDYRALSEGFLVAVGVVLAIMASFVTCFGLNLQKLSLCEAGNEDVSPWAQPKWVMGFVAVVVGSIIDFMAFGLAPQSLLAPLAALSLIWNLGMASYMLGETYTSTDIKAAGLIFVGTGLTVVFASHEEKEYTLDQLLELYRAPRMGVYFVAVPALLALHYGFIRAANTLQLPAQRAKTLEMLGYAGFAGIIGGVSVLMAKSVMELIKDAANGDNVFPFILLVVVIMAAALIGQITFLNWGLKLFDSLYVVPVYQSYWIISGVVGGLVYFGEVDDFTPLQMSMFVFGTLVTLAGLLVLTTKEHHKAPSVTETDEGYVPVPKPVHDSSSSLARHDSLEIDLPVIRAASTSVSSAASTSDTTAPAGVATMA